MRQPRVAMVLKVRDEQDILEHNLRVHHALGVERFVIIDHESSDAGVEVIERWERAGIAEWDRRSGDFASEASGWIEAAARRLAGIGIDWILHGDADEFWLPVEGSIPEALAEIEQDFSVVVAPRSEFVGRPGAGDWPQRLTVRETRSGLRPKLTHRADPSVLILDRGAHNIASEADDPVPAHGSERAVIRSAHRAAEGSRAVRFVWAPCWPLRIMHFPVRSATQIERRTQIYLYEASHGAGGRAAGIRERYERDGIAGIYADLIAGDDAVAAGLADGGLVTDRRIAELIARCPDPAGPDSRAAGWLRVESEPGTVERERRELARDAMRDLSRMNYRIAASQARLLGRIDQLEQRLRRARRNPSDDAR